MNNAGGRPYIGGAIFPTVTGLTLIKCTLPLERNMLNNNQTKMNEELIV
jgi:hypothetical protein